MSRSLAARIASAGMPEPEAAFEVELKPQAMALQEGEIVLLALRPSRWLLAMHLGGSAVVVALVAAALLFAGMGGGLGGWGGAGRIVSIAGVLWVPAASWFFLDWRTHRYVLTDRRMVSATGLFKPFVAEAPLSAIQRVALTRLVLERRVSLGSITGVNPHGLPLVRWAFVARPEEVQRTVLDAIRRYARGDVEP